MITDAPIAEIDFEAQGNKYVQMDNVIVAQAAPEASTVVIMLLGFGISGIAVIRHKRRQQTDVSCSSGV